MAWLKNRIFGSVKDSVGRGAFSAMFQRQYTGLEPPGAGRFSAAQCGATACCLPQHRNIRAGRSSMVFGALHDCSIMLAVCPRASSYLMIRCCKP
jgi:hypothetical protein